MILSRVLGQLGFEVFEAGHGGEALVVLDADSDFQIALVDLNMPEMDGLELLKRIRKDPRFVDLPVMTVTTETEMTRVAQAVESGASEYVMKPFTREIIEDKLRVLGLAS